MGARRRAGPAAVAAALLGLGLALHRPEAVPQLRAGPRAAPPRSWAPAASPEGERRGEVPAPAGSGVAAPREAAEEDIAVWRDALADRPFITGPGPFDAVPYVSGFASSPERAGSADRASAEAAARRRAERRASLPAASAATARPPRPAEAPRTKAPAGQAPPRRAPLALGPAPADTEEDEDAASAVAGRSGAARPGGGSWGRRRSRLFPLFKPPVRPRALTRAPVSRRRARPLLLSTLIGRGALRPPSGAIAPPDLSGLRGRRPLLLPDGTPVPVRPYDLDRIEALDPRGAGRACRRRARHWDAGPLWHDSQARGLIKDARWLWLWKQDARWWASRSPEDAPLLRHQGLWWSKQKGVWFALHDGELWSWRRFADWDAEGLIRLTDGVELVYSADFTKVAVITPGAGAVLYDAYTGAELGEWREDELPRRRPRAPSRLRLPRGI